MGFDTKVRATLACIALGACSAPGTEVLEPKVMLVIDRSDSMKSQVSDEEPYCTVDSRERSSGFDPTSPIPCKWKDLLSVLADPSAGFVARQQDRALFGLTLFPGGGRDVCAPGKIEVPIAQAPGETTASVLAALETANPGGGTPTTNTLDAVRDDLDFIQPDPDRARVVILLTDGVPNCNQANAPKCEACFADLGACFGTSACHPASLQGTFVPSCSWAATEARQCWDGDGLSASIAALRELGVWTYVVGVGSQTATPAAVEILNRAAIAGGRPLCGTSKYHQASSAEELARALDAIASEF